MYVIFIVKTELSTVEGGKESARTEAEDHIEEGLRLWTDKNKLPQHLKEEVIKQAIELDKDADVENLFSLLPWRTRRILKRFLFMNRMMAVCSSIKLKLVSPLSLHTHCMI